MTKHGLPKPDNLMQEIEEMILDDIYQDIDKIHAKIQFPKEIEIGGLVSHPFEENPETQKLLSTKESQRFKYDFVDKDLIVYMKDIILSYTTEEA